MQFFFQNKNKTDGSLADAISKACEGLTYTSETDAPMTLFCGQSADEITSEIILQQAGHDPNTPAEEVAFDAFFERLTEIKDWYGDAEKARAKKFSELRGLLKENLQDLKVLKAGEIQLDIFAVGRDKDGLVMGVKTKAVET